jgi:hypothetical protein
MFLAWVPLQAVAEDEPEVLARKDRSEPGAGRSSERQVAARGMDGDSGLGVCGWEDIDFAPDS